MAKSVASIRIIEMTDLRLFDLNLLVAFDALMSERNVTRAASRVGIGQPAMSHALSRLRELLGDDLFIRNSSGMQPTTRALELWAPVAHILAEIRESVLADRPFRPERSELVFRIGISDYAEVAVLPAVLAAMRISAPKARLSINAIDRGRVATMLQSGDIDLAIGYFPVAESAQRSEILFHEEFACLFDAEACGVTAPLKLQAYLDLPHILMSLHGELSGAVDAALARRGAKRFVFVATPHFLTIPFLLRGFRAVAALPRRLAENCAAAIGLAVCPLPLDIQGYDVSMLWHARSDADPAQRWLRDLVRDAGRARAAKSALRQAPRHSRRNQLKARS
jgi:LysR family transcriptional regulator, mexEF-oprN operon transcriptional activator